MKKALTVVLLLTLLVGCQSQSIKEESQERYYTKEEVEVILNNPDEYYLFMIKKPCVYAVRQIWKDFDVINNTVIDPKMTCIRGI